MDQGRVIQTGAPRDLYHRPATVRLGLSLGSAVTLRGTAAGRDGLLTVVETSLGRLRGQAAEGIDVRPGRTVACFFRPESLRLPAAGDGNRVGGTVRSVRFAGPWEHLTLEQNGTLFQAQIPSPALPTPAGVRLEFSLAPEALRILDPGEIPA
jgi:ABC-type Fe3+/spermidine/putrescine transport system ATPase subunit